MNHAPKNAEYKHKRHMRLDIISQSTMLLLKERLCCSIQRRATTTIMQANNVEAPRTKHPSTDDSHEFLNQTNS